MMLSFQWVSWWMLPSDSQFLFAGWHNPLTAWTYWLLWQLWQRHKFCHAKDCCVVFPPGISSTGTRLVLDLLAPMGHCFQWPCIPSFSLPQENISCLHTHPDFISQVYCFASFLGSRDIHFLSPTPTLRTHKSPELGIWRKSRREL